MNTISIAKWQYIKCLLAAIFSLPMLSGCFNLDEVPYTTLAPGNFYKTAEELEMGVTSAYRSFRNMMGSDRYYMSLESVTEFYSATNAKWDYNKCSLWMDMNNSDAQYIPTIWDEGFVVINSANLVLVRGEGVDMNQAEKERMYGEVRFLRAFANFVLLRLYGALPIPEGYTNSLEGLEIPRKTVEENYAQIIEDLKYAIEKLPLKSEYGTDKLWKASRGAAQALLGDVYLTRGCMEDAPEYFELAEEQLKTVVTSREYKLEPDFRNLWLWFNENCKNGSESLFELQFGETQNNGVTQYLGCWNGKINALGSNHFLRVGISRQAYLAFDREKDRRSDCVLTEFEYQGETLTYVPEDKGKYPGSKGWGCACPGNVKWYDRSDYAFNNNCSRVNIYLIRYADVLLNYAEAINYRKGVTPEALEAFNAVRMRAGLEKIDTFASADDFADAIYQERGLELLGEGQIYYDELRTGRISENVYSHLKNGIAEGLLYYEGQKIQFIPQKSFLWKIPTGDLNSNPALVQNPDNVSAPGYPVE